MNEKMRQEAIDTAQHYRDLAAKSTDPIFQLAYLVLADDNTYMANGDRGGPSDEMIQLAEVVITTNSCL